jgi:hypothetical protein
MADLVMWQSDSMPHSKSLETTHSLRLALMRMVQEEETTRSQSDPPQCMETLVQLNPWLSARRRVGTKVLEAM